MLGFAIGIAVAFLWLTLWTVVPRAGRYSRLRTSPEQREILRQHFLGKGKARYVIIEGILGPGLAFGLAFAVGDLMSRPSDGWILAVCKLVFVAVIFGLYIGFDGWVKLRGSVPFPPESLRER